MRQNIQRLSFLIFLSVFGLDIHAQSNKSENTLPIEFSKKLEDAKLVFIKPKGITEMPVVKNSPVHYEYAFKVDDKNVEVRYIIWPLTKEIYDSYTNREKKPGDTILYPGKLYKMAAPQIFSAISGGKVQPQQVEINNFNLEALQKEGVDAGGMYMGPVDPAFGKNYTFGFFTIFQKDKAGDVYALYLFENQEAMFHKYSEISSNDDIFKAIKFK